MTRIPFTAIAMAAVIVVTGMTTAFADEPSDDHRPKGHFGIGAGIGVRNGFAGVGFEARPVEYLSLTAGAGVAYFAGYSIGLEVFPIGRSTKVRPYVSLAAGEVVAPFGFGVDDMGFVAIGAGGEVGFTQRQTLDFGIDVVNGDDTFIFPSVSWKFHF